MNRRQLLKALPAAAAVASVPVAAAPTQIGVDLATGPGRMVCWVAESTPNGNKWIPEIWSERLIDQYIETWIDDAPDD